MRSKILSFITRDLAFVDSYYLPAASTNLSEKALCTTLHVVSNCLLAFQIGIDLLDWLFRHSCARWCRPVESAGERAGRELSAYLDHSPDGLPDFDYQTVPLPPVPNGRISIRTFLLDPGTGYEPICGRIETAVLGRVPTYEALSYCWGDPQKTTSITVSGRRLSVTRSLKVALWQLRHATERRRLWIDAICINQEDDDEKTSQVTRIRDVYAKASQCVVWLGPEVENTAWVFDSCRITAEAAMRHNADEMETSASHISTPEDADRLEIAYLDDLVRRGWRFDRENITMLDFADRFELFGNRTEHAQHILRDVSDQSAKMLLYLIGRPLIHCQLPETGKRGRKSALFLQRVASALEPNGPKTNAGSSETRHVQTCSSRDSPLSSSRSKRYSGLRELAHRPLQSSVSTTRQSSQSDFTIGRDRHAFADIGRRDWFYRAWIVQELAVAERVTVQCGSSTVDWDALAFGLDTMMTSTTDHPDNPFFTPTEAYNLFLVADARKLLQQIRHNGRAPQDLSLLWLLHTFRTNEASDPRDKIYAFIGLADRSEITVAPDYRRSVKDTLIVTAASLMRVGKRLELLSIPQGDPATRQYTLPSWVPDWIQTSVALPLPLIASLNDRMDVALTRTFRSFSASGDSTAEAVPTRENLLRLSGFSVGTIQSMSVKIPRVEDECAMLERKLPVDAETVQEMTGDILRVRSLRAGVFLAMARQERFVLSEGLTHCYPTGEEIQVAYQKTLFPAWDDLKMRDTKLAFEAVSPPGEPLWAIRFLAAIPRKLSFFTSFLVVGNLWVVSKLEDVLFPRQESVHLDLKNIAITMPHLAERRLAWMSTGFLAAVPSYAEVGDHVFLLRSGTVPYILRPSQGANGWKLVGDAYVYGMMYGEKWDETLCREVVIE